MHPPLPPSHWMECRCGGESHAGAGTAISRQKQKPSVKESSHNHAPAPAVLGCLGLNWYVRQKT